MSLTEVAKRLVLWHTPTFCPLMSHDDLEPILSSIGFISLPAHPRQPPSPSTASSADAQWKEYAFHSAAAAAAAVSGCIPPRPRLPFPMICGLHIIAYKAFLGALECYVDPSDLFHVRSVCPLHFSFAFFAVIFSIPISCFRFWAIGARDLLIKRNGWDWHIWIYLFVGLSLQFLFCFVIFISPGICDCFI